MYVALLLIALLGPSLAWAVEYETQLTWEHSGLDENGDLEQIRQWNVKVTGPEGEIVGEQQLADSDGSLRSVTLNPMTLLYNTLYTYHLFAQDANGNVSKKAAMATLELTDLAPPESPAKLIITVECPVNVKCMFVVNGTVQGN